MLLRFLLCCYIRYAKFRAFHMCFIINWILLFICMINSKLIKDFGGSDTF